MVQFSSHPYSSQLWPKDIILNKRDVEKYTSIVIAFLFSFLKLVIHISSKLAKLVLLGFG